MVDSLLKHIEAYIPVSSLLQARLTEICACKTIDKGNYLHRPGRVCTSTYFIEAGLLRIFYRKDQKEITDTFAAEGEWITSIYSFFKNVPDSCFIQTLEPCTLIAIHMDQLEQCFIDFPIMERFGRMLMGQYFVEQSERIISLQFHSAKERYAFFCKTAKNKAHRVPLGMLASHLGMSQETLSRIRAAK